MLSRDQSPAQREVRELRQRQSVLRSFARNTGKRAAMIGCPQLCVRERYFGACTTIRVAVMVKVPLMLGMALPSRP